MDYNSDRGEDDSYRRHPQYQQLPPSWVFERYKKSSSMSDGNPKLFVGGLSWETTDETFANYFAHFGKVANSIIHKHRDTGISKGFGFVTFVKPSSAEDALNTGHVIDGRKVNVQRPVLRGGRENSAGGLGEIFVGGLPPLLEEDELMNHFNRYGNVIKLRIMYDHETRRSKGYVFITFENEASVYRVFSVVQKIGGKQVSTGRPHRRDNIASSSGRRNETDDSGAARYHVK